MSDASESGRRRAPTKVPDMDGQVPTYLARQPVSRDTVEHLHLLGTGAQSGLLPQVQHFHGTLWSCMSIYRPTYCPRSLRQIQGRWLIRTSHSLPRRRLSPGPGSPRTLCIPLSVGLRSCNSRRSRIQQFAIQLHVEHMFANPAVVTGAPSLATATRPW